MLKISIVICCFCTLTIFGQDSLRIATWNIEHLGSEGRGFPEQSGLPFRSKNDLKTIADLIADTLNIDVLCIQEVAIHQTLDECSKNFMMDTIVMHLGENWKYFITYNDDPELELEMQNAFLYNRSKVELKQVFDLVVPDYKVGEKPLFDRLPLVGYFIPINGVSDSEGIVIVNLHLASGQVNDENHLAAMVIVEQNLKEALKIRNIIEPQRTYQYALQERIILGDFNDNPFALKSNGECCKYLDLMYQYMEKRGYKNLVTEEFISTRLSTNFNSIIDHVLVHHMLNSRVSDAILYMPCLQSDIDCLEEWRKVYSDHFLIYFDLGE